MAVTDISTSNHNAKCKCYEKIKIKHEIAEIVMINYELRNHVKLVPVLVSKLQQLPVNYFSAAKLSILYGTTSYS